MKTYDQWEKSKLDLTKFLIEPCEIDEEFYMYVAEVVYPTYMKGKFVQCGEATNTIDGVYHYVTVSYVNKKYFYLGVLPEFKQ